MRRALLSPVGWLLVVVGVVLYPLPGPGLLVLALGVAVLGRYDPWAARRLEPWRRRALRETARTVATWPRTLASAAATLLLGAAGVLWLVPGWGWLPGGTWAGVGQIVSGVVGLVLVAWARLRLGPARAGAAS